jgi:hypothetical protein
MSTREARGGIAVPVLLLWAAAGAGVALCVAILVLWGMFGPTYILDLIAAFCG